VGIAPDLGGQPRGKAGIALAQINLGLFRQAHQQHACLLVKPRIRWMSDGLLHHDCIERDPLPGSCP
jgi:hypothetical protein